MFLALLPLLTLKSNRLWKNYVGFSGL